MARKDEVPGAVAAASKRSGRVEKGSAATWVHWIRPLSSKRFIWRVKLWNSASVESTRRGRCSFHAGSALMRRRIRSWVFAEKATRFGSETPRVRATPA